MPKIASGPEVRAAKKWLETKGVDLPARTYANAAKQLDVGFQEVLDKLNGHDAATTDSEVGDSEETV